MEISSIQPQFFKNKDVITDNDPYETITDKKPDKRIPLPVVDPIKIIHPSIYDDYEKQQQQKLEEAKQKALATASFNKNAFIIGAVASLCLGVFFKWNYLVDILWKSQ